MLCFMLQFRRLTPGKVPHCVHTQMGQVGVLTTILSPFQMAARCLPTSDNAQVCSDIAFGFSNLQISYFAGDRSNLKTVTHWIV
jgi:hypothetical protein